MRFNNIFEEEYYFPCEGLTLDEGREFRYLMNNTFDFLEGDIIQMQLIKNGDVINANGMYGSNSGNKTFVGEIIKSKDGYVIRNTISNLDNGESKPIISETIFIYEGDNIKVISGGKSRVIEKISKEEFLNLPICKKVKSIIDESSINEYVKNKGIVKKHKEKFTDKFKEEINALKNTKYSSIYVVVCLIEQAVFLELLKDLTQLIPNDNIRLLFYAGGGILSFVIMLKILDMLVKKAGKKIENDVLMEMQSKGEYVPEKTDKIVECATMLGYMSPLLCVSTWVSGIENAQIYKWGIIILVHILGIGIPVLVKKKK